MDEQFYVLAASSRADDRTRVLKHGDTFGVFDRYGDVQPAGIGEQGLYHEGTRYLSRYELFLGTSRPLLLSSNVGEDNLVLTADLMNPDLANGDHSAAIPRGSVHVLRSRLIRDATCYEQLRLRNFGLQPVSFLLALRMAADYADMFEIRGIERTRRGRLSSPAVTDDALTLGYEGLDGVRRFTRVSCEPPPDRMSDEGMEFDVQLGAREERVLELQIQCTASEVWAARDEGFDRSLSRSVEEMRSHLSATCEVTTSNEQFNDWLYRSRSDLLLMLTEMNHGPYPYAGIPWFSTVFGRDGIVTALQTMWLDPNIARGVLSYLAATQGDRVVDVLDEEPGKIIHEVRRGEMAATGEVPYGRYYGSVDSTPLFIVLAGEYYRATGDREFCARLWPHVERALEWIDRFGDADGDGFVEYASHSPGGLRNQGWKDSGDCIFHADGTLAEGPIALCEEQGYVYAALDRAAEMCEALECRTRAESLSRRAEELRERFCRTFWDDTLGLYVLALDGEKRPCRVAASNAGQCLFTGIARPEHAQRIAERLMDRPMFSGWGLRTLADDQARYNPMSYHNGSVWPHDNSLIALGLARYGQTEAASRLLGAMLDVSLFVESHRLPELFCGFERRGGEGPILYPLACSPQSWAAGAVFLMLQACMGLRVRADRREVVFDQPTLPEFLQRVHMRNLPVGTQRIDVVLERGVGDVSVRLTRRAPGVRVVTVK